MGSSLAGFPNLPLTPGLDASKVVPNIKEALRGNGIRGPFNMIVYGNTRLISWIHYQAPTYTVKFVLSCKLMYTNVVNVEIEIETHVEVSIKKLKKKKQNSFFVEGDDMAVDKPIGVINDDVVEDHKSEKKNKKKEKKNLEQDMEHHDQAVEDGANEVASEQDGTVVSNYMCHPEPVLVWRNEFIFRGKMGFIEQVVGFMKAMLKDLQNSYHMHLAMKDKVEFKGKLPWRPPHSPKDQLFEV
ncbi:hypothetical protein VNO78_23625 [Psophocarpus tetragonolobus]|uniref:Uncharacterized protein n=1 Tax=Psophocarpus tetragonolobus TaxID=3891 RepID=A0AAN9XDR9_PSOTE